MNDALLNLMDRNTARHQRGLSKLDRWRQSNARRIMCPRCKLMVLPEGMARHDEIHHAE